MDRTGAVAGCTSPWNGHLTQELLKLAPDADIMNRMYGPAFMIRGESHLRANEELKWWWNDTDLTGGHVEPVAWWSSQSPRGEQISERLDRGGQRRTGGRDRETFKATWGGIPGERMVIWSCKRWTIGLIVRDGIVIEAPPIARKWALVDLWTCYGSPLERK
jgi:hypothetical protein